MMAEEEKEETKEEGGKTKKSPVLLIAIIAVSVILVIAIGLFAFLLTGSDEEPTGGGAAASKGREGAGSGRNVDMAKVGPMFEMDDFTVNLMSDSGKRYLRTKLNLELDSEDLMAEVNSKIPVLRDIIIQVLSSKQIEEIATRDGKERLKDEMVKAINRALIDGQVKNVYFSTFVIQ